MLAYLLVSPKEGFEQEVATILMNNVQVEDVRFLKKNNNLIIEINADDEFELQSFLLNQVLNIEGVQTASVLNDSEIN